MAGNKEHDYKLLFTNSGVSEEQIKEHAETIIGVNWSMVHGGKITLLSEVHGELEDALRLVAATNRSDLRVTIFSDNHTTLWTDEAMLILTDYQVRPRKADVPLTILATYERAGI